MSFGILTLATPNDYKKAIGLALSLKVSNPGVKLAVACSQKVKPFVEPFYDYVVQEDTSLAGFEHKVHLDRYSPFEETFFFDSDVLVFRPLEEVLTDWKDHAYTACGIYSNSGYSAFGLDRKKVLTKLNRDVMVQIDGAGHAFFKKPECFKVFETARKVSAEYQSYAGTVRYADEDVMNITMTMLDLPPMDGSYFFSRHLSAQPGTLKMDASKGVCQFIAVDKKVLQKPHMMHFAMNEAPFTYARELIKLNKKFHLSSQGLMKSAFHDFWTNFTWGLKTKIKDRLASKPATPTN